MLFDNHNEKSKLFNTLGLQEVMGMNKTQVRNHFGQHFNDVNCDIWMYHVKNLTDQIVPIKYLYLFFKNDILMEAKFSRIKKKLIYKLLKKS